MASVDWRSSWETLVAVVKARGRLMAAFDQMVDGTCYSSVLENFWTALLQCWRNELVLRGRSGSGNLSFSFGPLYVSEWRRFNACFSSCRLRRSVEWAFHLMDGGYYERLKTVCESVLIPL